MSHVNPHLPTHAVRVLAMPRRVAVSAVCAAAAIASGCIGMLPAAGAEAKPLAYVGTITYGKPIVEESRIVVPLRYEGGKWLENSSIVPIKVASTVVEGEVEITVLASVPRNGGVSGYELVLPPGLKGTYRVIYRDPDGNRHALVPITLNE